MEDKRAAVATSRSVSSDETEDGDGLGRERGADGDGDGSGSGSGSGSGNELKHHGDEHGLTLSRGRCIALVATVTGAAFLNASPSSFTCPNPWLFIIEAN
ncbi:hypothetical protein A9Z42_0067450 [Trichoderma parareesei]|uniref:Uncharacterized protein n=1 Tax=Trichoderma parareesei TaxID=858221 RepID=A0A2H2ZG99_TRIPA|nr:hypothetical protein A9Z42_0067450 [Trichoderma parareesei]